MKYNEYTLVTFGDSFSFGQGAGNLTKNQIMESFDRKVNWDANWQAAYRKDSNDNSYTRYICDNLKFKNYLNASCPGSSNGHILFNLTRFLSSNKDKNVFIIVGLTLPDREFYISKLTDINKNDNEYDKLYFSENIWYSNIPKNLRNPSDHITHPPTMNLSDKWFQEYYAYWVNKENIFFRAFNEIYTIIKLLQSSGHPHCVIDIINDFSRVLHDKLPIGLVNMHPRGYDAPTMQSALNVGLNTYNQTEKETGENFVTSVNEIYKNELEKSVLPYTHMWNFIETDLNLKVNKNKWLNVAAFLKEYYVISNRRPFNQLEFSKKYVSSHPGEKHWNKDAHILIANMITDYIRKNNE